ncbi:MAG TPA: alpha-L-glutamate ligase-like protein [Myxococcota bacterium]|jgi:alpha-L-glutamate ligase-like protein
MLPRRLYARGVLGINARNQKYTLRVNERRFYPLVDDKLATKRMCHEAGIPVPRLLAVAEVHAQAKRLLPQLAGESAFVLKPARGAMGNGILVIDVRDGKMMRGNRVVSADDFIYHAAGIISGLYSLAGHADAAMVEEKLVTHPAIAPLAVDGVPDLRVIVYRGIPVMAMMRLPTRSSGGRANLHQGALGVGIDLEAGTTTHAMLRNQSIAKHPDNQRDLIGIAIPSFDQVLTTAVSAAGHTGLGYVGADVVIDANLGPAILELNARPGLAIQLANRAGLGPRLESVDAALGAWRRGERNELSTAARVALGREVTRSVQSEAA